MKKDILVAFWSPYHGQTCTTANLVAVGTYIGIKYNIKTLLMHSQFAKSNLENAFIESELDFESLLFDETGIDALERLARTKQLSPQNFTDYTKTILNARLDLLVGTAKTSETVYEKLIDSIPYIMGCAKQAYDLVLCDVNAGVSNPISNKSMEMADLIVVNLNQNIEVLKSFFNREEWHSEMNKKNYILVLGNYDAKSKYTAAYIKRLFHYKDEIYTIPRNVDFMDAHNDHSVMRYFYSNFDVSKEENRNYRLIKELQKLSQRIVSTLLVDESYIDRPLRALSMLETLAGVFRK